MRRLLVSLLFLPAALFAQAPQVLSLSEAEAQWRAHSRELRLAEAAVGGASADVQAAGQRPNPTASMNVLSISPWSGYREGGWKDKKMDTQLRVDQVIERGDKRDLRVKGAEARLEAARRNLDDAGRTQLLALQSAYFDLMLAQDRRRITAEAAELYARAVEAAQLRLRAGDLSLVELSRQQIERARAENDARLALSDLERAQAALAYLLGREEDARQLVAGDPWPPLAASVLTEKSLERRADVEAARLRVVAAENARDLARAQKKRDVTVGFQLEHNLQNAPTNSYGFGVSVPLFIWHEFEGEIARAEADLDAARVQYERTLALARGDVDQARSVLTSAEERRRRLETGLLADAEKVAKAAEFAYKKGAMGVMDLLDARRTLRQVQIEAATARAEHAKALAAWRLQAETGRNQ